MAERTAISWTHHTFNPWWGCTKVSPACDRCYAERDAKRFAAGRVLWGVDAERRTFGDKHWHEPVKWNAAAERDGERRRVFCASMADVFENRDDVASQRAKLFALIACTPWLDWLLLTKRIGNVARMIEAPGMQRCGLPPNVWLGSTVVTQEEADRDVPKLLALPARVRFLSIEPMLGPINLGAALWQCCGDMRPGNDHGVLGQEPDRCCGQPEPRDALHWVICGGESGPGARPMHPDWVRSLRDQCRDAGVPFHFKQWGEWGPPEHDVSCAYCVGGIDAEPDGFGGWIGGPCRDCDGTGLSPVVRLGRDRTGRSLDGIVHDAFPKAA